MHRRLLLIAVVLCLGAGHAGAQTRYEAAGPFTVETALITVADAQTAKHVETKVYYPAGAGPFPVIAFSHGLGGDREAFEVVARHWAGHGYVSLHPSHNDTGISPTPTGVHPPADKVLERVADLKSVLNGFNQIEAQVPDLRGKLDTGRIGVAGHSYGSFITMLMGGVRADIGDVKNRSVADSRVRCVIPIAPAGRGDYGLNDDSWKDWNLPAMVFSGTRDIRNGRAETWREEPFEFAPAGRKYLVRITDANHGSYGAADDPSDAARMVQAASTAFWDGCLNGSASGWSYLNPDGGFTKFADSGVAHFVGK